MWISRGEYRRLLKQLARAERRAESAEQSLAIERHENNRMLRHMTNMWLRSRQGGNTFPLQPEQPKVATPAEELLEPIAAIDEGELEAFVAVGAQYGVSARDAENLLRAEKGLPPKQ